MWFYDRHLGTSAEGTSTAYRSSFSAYESFMNPARTYNPYEDLGLNTFAAPGNYYDPTPMSSSVDDEMDWRRTTDEETRHSHDDGQNAPTNGDDQQADEKKSTRSRSGQRPSSRRMLSIRRFLRRAKRRTWRDSSTDTRRSAEVTSWRSEGLVSNSSGASRRVDSTMSEKPLEKITLNLELGTERDSFDLLLRQI